jgi:hypothetical protein
MREAKGLTDHAASSYSGNPLPEFMFRIKPFPE